MEVDEFIASFKRLSPDDQNRLLALLKAKECFNRAVDEDSNSAYSEAFQLAEQALKYWPHSQEIHFIAGLSRLKAWGDKSYALKKYKLLMALGLEGIEFANRLKAEIH